MSKRFSRRLLAIILIAITLSASAAGVVSFSFMQPKSYIQVWGMVMLDAPVEGATVSVYDSDGKLLLQENDATYTTGSFILEVPLGINQWTWSIPTALRIEAHGGNLGNQSFDGTIIGEIANYTQDTYCKLNAITALIATYHARHPEIQYVDAAKAVAHFIEVPDGLEIAQIINNCEWDDTSFSHEHFMNEAQNAGGFSSYVDILVSELESGKQHPIKSQYFSFGLGEAAGWLGEKIIGGAISAAVGAGFNWIMYKLGYRSPTDKMIEEMKTQLTNMSKELTAIQGKLDSIEKLQQATVKQIDEVTKQLETKIEKVYKGLKWETEFSALKLRSALLATAITQPKEIITTAFNRLQYYSKLNPAKLDTRQQNSISQTVDDILSTTNGIEPQLMFIHDYLMGSLDMGLLEVWSTLTTIGAKDKSQLYNLYDAVFNRFSYLLSIEFIGINLMIEAYHAKHGSETAIVNEFWLNWKVKIRDQLDQFLSFSEKIAASRIDNLSADEFSNPNMYPQGMADSYILQQVDALYQQLVSSLNANLNAPKVLTLRIINYPTLTKNLPANLSLQLYNLKTKQTFSPTIAEQRNDTTFADWNFNTVPYQLNHYTFKVPDGTYQLRADQTPYLLSQKDQTQNITQTASDQYKTLGVVSYCEHPETKPHLSSQRIGNYTGNLAIDKNGFLYCTDINANMIRKFDSNGTVVMQWGSNSSTTPQFGSINNCAVDNKRYLYAVDYNSPYYIHKFNTTNGNQILAWGSSYVEPYSEIATDKQGHVYVRHPGILGVPVAPGIYKFDDSGKFLLDISTGYYYRSNNTNYVTSITCDCKGYLYTTNHVMGYIMKYDSNGTLVQKWGNSSYLGREFYPSEIVVDNKGYIYVTTAVNMSAGKTPKEFISKFDGNGNFLFDIGWDDLNQTGGLAVNQSNGDLYVVDYTRTSDKTTFYLDKYVTCPAIFVSEDW